MKTFLFQKLVRDKIPQAIKSRGGIVTPRRLSQKKYVKELIKKLNEETSELGRNLTSTEVAEELADIIEVVTVLQKVFKISDSELQSIRQKKNLKNGAFNKRLFIDRRVSDENGH
mgnify:CR=1 FL=1